MSDWNYLNRCRVRAKQDPMFGTTEADGFNGFFCLKLNGLPVKVIASDGMGWQHVSVSLASSNNPPSWPIMCQVKDLFFEPTDWVCQFHPAHSEYVNNHPGCLHLWRYTAGEFPKPDRLMVGFKDDSDIERLESGEAFKISPDSAQMPIKKHGGQPGPILVDLEKEKFLK